MNNGGAISIGCHVLHCEDPVTKVKWADRLCAELDAALVLNTCQRLEVYGAALRPLPGVTVAEVQQGTAAIERLARIAAGLESRILGELEVLGQVRMAYKHFRSSPQWRESNVDRVFQKVLSIARKARRESGIDRNVTSIASLAGQRIAQHVPDGQPIAVIGTGSLASSVARHLVKRSRSPVRIASRCPVRAGELAESLGVDSGCLSELTGMLAGVAGIVCATAAPHPVLFLEHLQACQRPLFIVDLSVPHDCHPDIEQDTSVIRIPLEQIEQEAFVNMDERHKRAEIASAIIRSEVSAIADSVC